MLHEENIQTLRDFGFTYLQAKVYLSLVKTGNSTIKKIAETTNIARQEAQRVTGELLNMGLVIKKLARPIVYEPVSMKNTVATLLERRKKATMELTNKANNLVKNCITSHVTDPINEEPQFVIISGKEYIIRKTRKIVDETNETIDVINGIGNNAAQARYIYEEQTTKALQRNVKFRLIIQQPSQQSDAAVRSNNSIRNQTEIRYLKFPLPATFGIYDKREMIVYTSPEKPVGDSQILWTDSPTLILAVQAYFEQLWQKATVPSIITQKPKT